MTTYERSLTFKGCFDVGGREAAFGQRAFFEAVVDPNEPRWSLELHVGDRVVRSPSEVELRRSLPRLIAGRLNAGGAVYPGATVEFIREHARDGLLGEVLVATATVDAGGRYVAAVPTGEYTVRVHAGGTTTTLRNVRVDRGLGKPTWLMLDGLIARRVADVITFHDCPYVQVRGQLLDAKGTPVDAGEVVVHDDRTVYAHVVTDDDGWFACALPKGELIVRLIAYGSPTKVLRVVVAEDRGFSEQLRRDGLLATGDGVMSVDVGR